MTIDRTLKALNSSLCVPVNVVRDTMAPGYRLHPALEASGTVWREAAVMIVLYVHEGLVRFPLILRPAGQGVHASQISLPGGSREDGETLEACALRETNEELGVEPRTVRIVRTLSPLRVPPSRFEVTPFVGVTEARPLFCPSTAEVAGLFEPSVDELLDRSTKEYDTAEFAGRTWRIPCYRLVGQRIWGATAMILAEFEALLANA